MSEYRFDISNFTIDDMHEVHTIADMHEVQQAAQAQDVYALLRVANRFIPINLFALPYGETAIVIRCFYQALTMPVPEAAPTPIDQLIQKALEETGG